MTPFVMTLLASLAVFGLCLMGLAIGLILTGKPRIVRGTCGYDPTKKPGSCGSQKKCSICSNPNQTDTQ